MRRIHFNGPLTRTDLLLQLTAELWLWGHLIPESSSVCLMRRQNRGFGWRQARAVAAVKLKYATARALWRAGGHICEAAGDHWPTKAADVSFVRPPLSREAFMCPARTACRELTRGTAGSVASCWPLTGACTRTMSHWWRRFRSSSRLL